MRATDCVDYLLPLFFSPSLTMSSFVQLVKEKRRDLIKKLEKNWGTVDEIQLELLENQVHIGKIHSASAPPKPTA